MVTGLHVADETSYRLCESGFLVVGSRRRLEASRNSTKFLHLGRRKIDQPMASTTVQTVQLNVNITANNRVQV